MVRKMKNMRQIIKEYELSLKCLLRCSVYLSNFGFHFAPPLLLLPLNCWSVALTAVELSSKLLLVSNYFECIKLDLLPAPKSWRFKSLESISLPKFHYRLTSLRLPVNQNILVVNMFILSACWSFESMSRCLTFNVLFITIAFFYFAKISPLYDLLTFLSMYTTNYIFQIPPTFIDENWRQ